MATSRKRHFNKFYILVLVVCCLPLMGQIAHHGYQIYQVQKETVRTEKRVADLKKKTADLEKEKTNLGDLRYIEKVAREELNMVKKDEIPLFMIKDKSSQPTKK